MRASHWKNAPALPPGPANGGKGPLSASHRFAALDSLRGLCALVVALFHFHTAGVITNLLPVLKGWLFVDFFFVLSGFVLAHSYAGRVGGDVSALRFLGLRLGRIYPLHIAVLLLMLVLELVLALSGGALAGRPAFGPGHSAVEWVASALLLHASGVTGRLSWNGPSWSIAAEFWAYLLFAALALTKRVWPFAIVCGAALAALCVLRPDLHEASYDLGMVRCMYGFSLGVLLWRFRGPAPWRPGVVVATLAELFVAAAILIFTSAIWSSWPTLLGPPLFGCAVLIFAEDAGLLSRLLKTAPFALIGTLSYSVYMIHPFVQARLMELLSSARMASTGADDRVTATGWAADAATLAMVALVVAVAGATYRWVERPGREWSRRRFGASAAEVIAPTF